MDLHDFYTGRTFDAHRFFGAHFENVGETEGVMFRVWAPRAKAVSVVGDFNSWIPSATPMKNIDPQGGIWERFVPGIRQFDIYKYCVTTPASWYSKQTRTPSMRKHAPRTAARCTRWRIATTGRMTHGRSALPHGTLWTVP